MSEYQYYEFLALDQLLTPQEMAELRRISSRAEISPRHFFNTYDWGDLKADPMELLARYFDAHVYYANWGTCWFAARLPQGTLDEKTIATCCPDLEGVVTYPVLEYHQAEDCQLVRWYYNLENWDEDFIEDGEGWIERLTPLRGELLRGDYRSLYLGWLASVSLQLKHYAGYDHYDGEALESLLEPPPPPGLNRLSATQKALVEFLAIDPDLVYATGIGTQGEVPDRFSEDRVRNWVSRQNPERLQELVTTLLLQGGGKAEALARRLYLAADQPIGEPASQGKRRTVAELLALAEGVRRVRLEREAKARAAAEAERRRRREAFLRRLMTDPEPVWRAVEAGIERKNAKGYADAVHYLQDLAEGYRLEGQAEEFQRRFRSLMEPYGNRRALWQRLKDAGLA